MDARVCSLHSLLSARAVYHTPFFQRPYRWRERNWAAFWAAWRRASGLDAAALGPRDRIDDVGGLDPTPTGGFGEAMDAAADDAAAEHPYEAEAALGRAEAEPLDAEEDAAAAPARSPPRHMRHFLGAIVLQPAPIAAEAPRPGAAGPAPALHILDGQQRLLTATAALRALTLAADALGAAETAQRLRQLQLAPSDAAPAALGYRVVASRPSQTDQSMAMTASASALAAARARYSDEPDSAALQRATDYLHQAVLAALGDGDPGRQLSRLIAGLTEQTHLVAIVIDRDMDAFEVFETLNNLGEPLSTLDLVKNRLFEFAARDPVGGGRRDPDSLVRLYQRHWRVLDDPETLDFWGRREARGGDRRLNQDWFLRAYLSARTGREVRGDEIQDELALALESGSADGAAHIAEVGRAAAAFLEIGGHAEPERHAERVAALRLYGNVSTEPALVAIRMHLWEDAAATEAVLDMLESCVVRRFFTKADGSSYEVFARLAGLIGPGAAQRGPEVISEVRRALKAARRGAFWPSDRVFRKGFATRELVARGGATLKRNGKPIFYHVYERLDAAARSAAGGLPRSDEFDRHDLSVEHLYPLRGRKHWPQPKRAEAPWLRTIGNLAAIPAELNGRLGQWRWDEKRDELREGTDIHLNRLISTDPRWAVWSVKKIKQRGDELADLAIKVWSRPT